MKVAAQLDVLWAKRGGFQATARRLIAYAHMRIGVRSTATRGGQQVARLHPEDVFQDALIRALTADDCPVDGEQLYRLIRRHIDNGLRTLEKSPAAPYEIGIVNEKGIPGTIPVDSLSDDSCSDSDVSDEEEGFNQQVVEIVKTRFKANGQESRLLTLILEKQGDKTKLCSLMSIDGATFDRLKYKLKVVVKAVNDELKKTAKR